MKSLQKIPPSPEVMADLYMEYRRAKVKGLSFRKYLEAVGFRNPAESHLGMDDGHMFRARAIHGPELISIPSQPIKGELNVVVLLIDFEDRVGNLNREHYADLLFSKNIHPTGSMRDYFDEVSLGKVNVTGSVHGWYRMPNKYSYYTNGESGTKWNSYPRNAPRMAEDAVKVALDNGVTFAPELDKLNKGSITALFIVHAGLGAEVIRDRERQGHEIWSHKWVTRNPVSVGSNLVGLTYLTVPYDCKLGVCAHELGHLAFQWQDFYDPNYDEDGKEWDGAGNWDLMAGGSYNGGGNSPAHPVGLHKAQHGWIDVETVTSSLSLTLPPYTPTSGMVAKVLSTKYKTGQYLILENRTRTGFDFHLPESGMLVWRVDESGEMFAPDRPGLLLIQADGRHNLEDPHDMNQGDAGDPFPGRVNRTNLSDSGNISTSFPGEAKSQVSLNNIQLDSVTGNITLDVVFGATQARSKKKGTARKKTLRKKGRKNS